MYGVNFKRIDNGLQRQNDYQHCCQNIFFLIWKSVCYLFSAIHNMNEKKKKNSEGFSLVELARMPHIQGVR